MAGAGVKLEGVYTLHLSSPVPFQMGVSFATKGSPAHSEVQRGTGSFRTGSVPWVWSGLCSVACVPRSSRRLEGPGYPTWWEKSWG